MTTPAVRPLDPAEIYYELLDRRGAMNGGITLTLDRRVDHADVERAWAGLTAALPVLRGRVERRSPREGVVVVDDDAVPAPLAVHADLPSAWADEALRRFDPAHPDVRAAVTDGDTTSVHVTGHHSLVDGRALVQLGSLLVAALAEPRRPLAEIVAGHPLTAPTVGLHPALLPEHSWSGRRVEMLGTARAARGEETHVGRGGTLAWHDPEAPGERDVRFTTFELDPATSAALLAWARSAGVSMHGALSAALTRATGAVSPGLERLSLQTAVDLRGHTAEPEGAMIGLASAIVSGSYPTDGDPVALAADIAADVRRRVERGEGEMVFALSGVERLAIGPEADAVVEQWMRGVGQTVCLSNVGVVLTPTGDVRAVHLQLAPMAHQAAYVVATTAAGVVTIVVCADLTRAPAGGEELAAAYEAELRRLAALGSAS